MMGSTRIPPLPRVARISTTNGFLVATKYRQKRRGDLMLADSHAFAELNPVAFIPTGQHRHLRHMVREERLGQWLGHLQPYRRPSLR